MGKWEKVKLYEICDLLNGYAFKSSDYIEHSNTLNCRMSNIRPNGTFNILYNAKYLPDEYIKKYENFRLTDGDVIIAMTDMANEPKILGVPTIVKTEGFKCLLNQRVGKLIYNERKISPDYLRFVLGRDSVKKYYQKFSSGGLQINLGKSDLLSLEIPLPPLEIQQKIAANLDTATALLKLRQQQLAELEALIQSVFYQMFGDPVRNEKGWKRIIFGELGNFKNGINYRSNESKYEVKCLSVGDFKDYKMITDTSKLKRIILEEKPKQEILLKKDDLIFVRSNGSKSLVGRCVLIADLNEELTFSGFCIRFRNSYSELNAIFLNEFFNLETIHRILTQDGRGCSINNLNQDLLSKVKIPLPPLSLQTQFATIVQKIEQQKALVQQSIDETQTLFDSLMSQYFD